jgi:hypothetical protein
MSIGYEEQRQSSRTPCSGVVTILTDGASLKGRVEDISAGGIGLVLEGKDFTRGTPVAVQFADGLNLAAWVSHCTTVAGTSRLGLSFSPVSSATFPQSCFDTKLCILTKCPYCKSYSHSLRNSFSFSA